MPDQQRTVVMSDIHIGNGAAYSWFLPPYPDEVSAMFNQVANDSNVEELVLLGDLFDLWLYPLDVVPWTVAQIVEKYPSITQALRQCVHNKPHVYYMTGNHDMGVGIADLEPFSAGGNGIHLVTPDWYNAKYQNQRHLEHGHGVDMFNAQDKSRDTIGGYSLGFFITDRKS